MRTLPAVLLLLALAGRAGAQQYIACSEGRWGTRCENKCYCPEGPGCWCDDGITGTGTCYCWEGWVPLITGGDRRPCVVVRPSPEAQHETVEGACNAMEPLHPQWILTGRYQDLGVASEPGNRPRDISEFSTRVMVTPLPSPRLLLWSDAAARDILGHTAPSIERARLVTDMLCGNKPFPAAPPPLATLYAGHQFGSFRRQLGDGRAVLLGEVESPGAQGRVLMLQLKGAGRTPFSRQGDGRVPLHAAVREYLASAYLAALGVPVARVLSVVQSASLTVARDPRDDGSTVRAPAAVIMRAAPSFVRFGTFDAFHARRDDARLRLLADFTIRRHFPWLLGDAGGDAGDNPLIYSAFLHAVTQASARLVAVWQAVGFVHGVMNTDNTGFGSVIDLGPFGFMGPLTLAYVPNESDTEGRYSFKQQPAVMLHNVLLLARTLAPSLVPSVQHEDISAHFWSEYNSTLVHALFLRLGLRKSDLRGYSQLVDHAVSLPHASEADLRFVHRMFAALEATHLDYTYFFRHAWCLCAPYSIDSTTGSNPCDGMRFLSMQGHMDSMPSWHTWHTEYCDRASVFEGLRENCEFFNPVVAFRKDDVFAGIEALLDSGDAAVLEALDKQYNDPYAQHPGRGTHPLPRKTNERQEQQQQQQQDQQQSKKQDLRSTVSCSFQ